MLELRRKLLKGGVSASMLAPWLGLGLLQPTQLLAAEWQRNQFTARNIADALKASGAANAAESRELTINAPEIAENGAKVEVDIASNLANTRSLALFADKNPMPLCATFEFLPPSLPAARVPLKLAESTRLRLVAKTSDGKTHVAFRDVKVTLGGCGG
ncbi:MAG: thiosulfate oxidation carrier protein SoxY [Rhodocyclales bacterium]|nr:thiosulfate oxidation carrier protein SoxY [Rhodocyclales bacterium]